MQLSEVLPFLVSESRLSMTAIARAMGRSRNFIRTTVERKTIPRTGTLAEIADACGYRIELVKRDGTDVIAIDALKEDLSDLLDQLE